MHPTDASPASGRTLHRRRPRLLGAAALLALALLTLLGATTGLVPSALGILGAGEPRDVTVELRSWVVAGRGRHMFAQVLLPGMTPEQVAPSAEARWPSELPLVAEYWSTALRDDYRAPEDFNRIERIARMPLGHRVRPMGGEPDNRLEATYRVTMKQARDLMRDRVFSNRYFLLGPNSSSGLRAAMEAAGLKLPAQVLAGGGIMGEFPGVDFSPGREIPRSRWGDFGLGAAPAARESHAAGTAAR